MADHTPGRTVSPEQAAETLRWALAWRGIEVEAGTGGDGVLTLTTPSELVVSVAKDYYHWPVGGGLQIHPVSDPKGAAALIADQENDGTWRLRRRHPGWMILRPTAGTLIAIPIDRRLWELPTVKGADADELAAAIAQAETAANRHNPDERP